MKAVFTETIERVPGGEHTADTVHAISPAPLSAAMVTGRIIGFAPSVGPLVDFPGNTAGVLLLARSVVAVTDKAIGQEVVLAFEDGDLTRPLILGVVQSFDDPDPDPSTLPIRPGSVDVTTDGNRLLLTAHDEVVLRCGRASITLTAAGKVLIRGEYLLSRSSGANRIKGGSVQIN